MEARRIAEDGMILRVQVGSGVHGTAEVLDAITSAETQLAQLRETTSVPEQPDRGWVDDWLHRSHLSFWASRR